MALRVYYGLTKSAADRFLYGAALSPLVAAIAAHQSDPGKKLRNAGMSSGGLLGATAGMELASALARGDNGKPAGFMTQLIGALLGGGVGAGVGYVGSKAWRRAAEEDIIADQLETLKIEN